MLNTVVCCDALIGMKHLIDNGIKADLIVTDPPYRLTPMGQTHLGGMMIKAKEMNGELFPIPDVYEWMKLCYDILKDGTHCYVMCNNINLQEFLDAGNKAGFKFVKNLIWVKGNKITGRFYMNAYEYIIFFRKGKQRQINKCGTADVLNISFKKLKGDNGKNLHDTEKPVELMKILIENSSNENELVIDPFAGIGSTGVACKDLNRQFIGFECNQQFTDIALKRISENN